MTNSAVLRAKVKLLKEQTPAVCYICGGRIRSNATVDHIIPKKYFKGPKACEAHRPTNLALAHENCNRKKNAHFVYSCVTTKKIVIMDEHNNTGQQPNVNSDVETFLGDLLGVNPCKRTDKAPVIEVNDSVSFSSIKIGSPFSCDGLVYKKESKSSASFRFGKSNMLTGTKVSFNSQKKVNHVYLEEKQQYPWVPISSSLSDKTGSVYQTECGSLYAFSNNGYGKVLVPIGEQKEHLPLTDNKNHIKVRKVNLEEVKVNVWKK